MIVRLIPPSNREAETRFFRVQNYTQECYIVWWEEIRQITFSRIEKKIPQNLHYYVADEVETSQNVVDIGAHSRSVLDLAISFQGARLSKFSNRFTAYNFVPIELKLGRMIPDISPFNGAKPDFSIPSRGAPCEPQISLELSLTEPDG